MGPALSPGAVGQEMAACAVLGGVLGAARAVLPTRIRLFLQHHNSKVSQMN